MYSDSAWRGPVVWAGEPCMCLVSTCAGFPLLSFCLLFFLIYLSQTLQAVAMGWQAARANILLKETVKPGSSLFIRTRLLQHSIASIPPPDGIRPSYEEPSLIHLPSHGFFSPLHTHEKPGPWSSTNIDSPWKPTGPPSTTPVFFRKTSRAATAQVVSLPSQK